MKTYTTDDPYNVLAFDGDIQPRPEPITLAGETIRPGDEITAILGRNSSAGFGSFEMIKGCITYAGMHTVNDARGARDYVLFNYPFPRDKDGKICGHKTVFVGWGYFVAEGEACLFYLNRSGSGRLILPRQVIRKAPELPQ